MLQLPSGNTSLLILLGILTLRQKYSLMERRVGENILRDESVRACGEIQSQPEKRAAYSQAAIYTIGGPSKLVTGSAIRKMATVLTYKDITAHAELATLDASCTESLGEVAYKLVDSVPGYNLKSEKELNRFSTALVATLEETMKQ